MGALLLFSGFSYGWNFLLMAYFVPYMVSSSPRIVLFPEIDCALFQLCNHWYVLSLVVYPT